MLKILTLHSIEQRKQEYKRTKSSEVKHEMR